MTCYVMVYIMKISKCLEDVAIFKFGVCLKRYDEKGIYAQKNRTVLREGDKGVHDQGLRGESQCDEIRTHKQDVCI